MQLTRFSYDAMLPIVRPDSVVIPLTPGLWGLYTPSCWPDREEGTMGPVIAMGEKDELVAELERIGTVEISASGNTHTISRITTDRDWWEHRAEDGMLPMSILEGK